MNPIAEDMLIHYGVKRRSGRYPWGSGEDPYQNSCDFLGRVKQLRKENFTYTDEEGKTWTGDNAIAKSLGISSGEFRNEMALANSERTLLLQAKIKSLSQDGLGPTEIGRKLHLSEGTVRSMQKNSDQAVYKALQIKNTADFIRDQVNTRGMIDVGGSSHLELNVSKEKMEAAIQQLWKEGYEVYAGGMDNVTNAGKRINQKVICPPGTQYKDIYDLENVHSLKEYISRDGGETYEKKFHYPESMDSKRMTVRYVEDGGADRDGLVEIRRGVKDLSLEGSNHAQVRILVDGTHYIKGMAVYTDGPFPDGVDVIFNTNKSKSTPVIGPKDNTVLKPIKKEDPENPFGSLIKDAEQGGQYWYTDTDGKKKLGLINKRSDEGDWSEWADKLPAQFLSKQTKELAQKQLNLAKSDKAAEYDDICSITNPVIKKHYLLKFAEDCDSTAVDLKAAALPGQKYHVIIPINTLKDNEIYAPKYENGTKLALIRYPHGGTFEIPLLTVNNKNPLGKEIISKLSDDAVGINKRNADILSGADFDGDTVMCIPTHDPMGKVKIKTRETRNLDGPLKELEGFDPKSEYRFDEVVQDSNGNSHYYKNGREFKVMSNTNTQMGIISNLITDMTLGGAPDDEMVRAIKHSMVVIDAEKHKLDYRKSEIDNGIAALHNKWQGHYDENGKWHSKGASTIISRSKGEVSVDKRQGNPKVNLKGKSYYDPTKPEGALLYKTTTDLYYPVSRFDKKTGKKTLTTIDGKKIEYDVNDEAAKDLYTPVKRIDKETGEVSYTDKTGTIKYKLNTRTDKSSRMAETDDANSLVSQNRHPMELLYADYANSMKAMANKARKEAYTMEERQYSESAKKIYAAEVKSLDEKLTTALLNSNREREAQRRANVEISNKKTAYEEKTGESMSKSDVKKIGQQALNKTRSQVGAIARRDRNIDITDREWEAIQAGAISNNMLTKILNNTDADKLRERATPKTTTTLSAAQITRAKNLANSNYTLEEIAKKMGKSPSTIAKILKGKE